MSRKKLKDNIKKLIKQHLNEAHRVWHTPGYDDKYPKAPMDKPKGDFNVSWINNQSNAINGIWRITYVTTNPNGGIPTDYQQIDCPQRSGTMKPIKGRKPKKIKRG